jgi:hypothetical protein
VRKAPATLSIDICEVARGSSRMCIGSPISSAKPLRRFRRRRADVFFRRLADSGLSLVSASDGPRAGDRDLAGQGEVKGRAPTCIGGRP